MNIIQIQDKLKGLPNEALVNYVEEPMGEVPIYLALGELQRRKEMRERFQASQTPPPSVSEQLVAENKPQQMGLGAMAPQGMMPPSSPTQGVGAPQPQPQMDPRQLAASGIASNPVSNVGGPAMMAGGGIVGYANGGNIGDIDMSDWSYGWGRGYAGDAAGSTHPDYPQYRVDQVGQWVTPEGNRIVKGKDKDGFTISHALDAQGEKMRFEDAEGNVTEEYKGERKREPLTAAEIEAGYKFGDVRGHIEGIPPPMQSDVLAGKYRPHQAPYLPPADQARRDEETAFAEKELQLLDTRRRIGRNITDWFGHDDPPEVIPGGPTDTTEVIPGGPKVIPEVIPGGPKYTPEPEVILGGPKDTSTDTINYAGMTDEELKAYLKGQDIDLDQIGSAYAPWPYNVRETSGIPFFPKSTNIDNFMGQREKINTQLGIDNKHFDTQREQAANLGLIQAGLAIAGGTSANPLENISAGALPALAQYNKAIAAADAGTRAELINARDAFIAEQSEIRKIQSDLFSDFFESEGMKATAKGDVAVKAFDRTIKYVKLYLNDASLETFYQEDHSLAARTFQRINNVFFDAFNENRAVNTSEIDKIMIESGYKRYKNN